MEQDITKLLVEIVQRLQQLEDLRFEVRAITDVLVDTKVVTEQELTDRIKDLRFTAAAELRAEAKYRATAEFLSRLPKQ